MTVALKFAPSAGLKSVGPATSSTTKDNLARRHCWRKRNKTRISKPWKEENDIRDCPGCKTEVEKIDGCNHMTCVACQCHFCWVCCATFNEASQVYEHLKAEHNGIYDEGEYDGWEDPALFEGDEDEEEEEGDEEEEEEEEHDTAMFDEHNYVEFDIAEMLRGRPRRPQIVVFEFGQPNLIDYDP